MTDERIAQLEALYEAATPGRRKVVNLNDGDPMEYGPFWAVTNDALDAEQDWAVEIRFGGKEDADFDAEIYNALPELLAAVRHLNLFKHWLALFRGFEEQQDRLTSPADDDITAAQYRAIRADRMILIRQIEEVLAGNWEAPDA